MGNWLTASEEDSVKVVPADSHKLNVWELKEIDAEAGQMAVLHGLSLDDIYDGVPALFIDTPGESSLQAPLHLYGTLIYLSKSKLLIIQTRGRGDELLTCCTPYFSSFQVL